MTSWNFAIVVDAIAHATPDREVVVAGPRRFTWQMLASRSRALAWHLATEAGVHSGDRVALVLPNCPEYLEAFLAARKLRAVPLGVGASSGVNELHAVIDRSDARVVVCAEVTATDVRAAVRRIPKRWRPVVVEVGEAYEAALAAAVPPTDWDLETPTADDLIAIAELDASAASGVPGDTLLPVGPFAEGDTFGELLGALSRKGRAALLDPPDFEGPRVWETVAREGVVTLAIGGNAQARPLLTALTAAGDARRIATLATITSTGAPLSADVAAALSAALPNVTILGADETLEASTSGGAAMILPSDVEHRLRKHASVVDCVVLGISDPRIGKLVVAVIQVVDNHYLDAPELAAWCRAHLSAEMTPAQFVFVGEIVRAPSGEADELALRDLAIDQLLGGGSGS